MANLLQFPPIISCNTKVTNDSGWAQYTD